ncbi:hypothetical protein AtubIFM55763_000745 [Aspergillus tubingensis]|nr:hypothetical protein AtubIFM55763_000745 [Aspergillus tubingensis]
MTTFGLHQDGPYGGFGGSAYNATDGEQKIKHVDAWETNYNGYEVLGAIDFQFQNGDWSGRIGGRDPGLNYYKKSYDFADDETIKHMDVYAGHDDGYVNGFKFSTSRQDDAFVVGGDEGNHTELKDDDLGANGEWAGATGRDNIHGADAVVDNMILYFKE